MAENTYPRTTEEILTHPEPQRNEGSLTTLVTGIVDDAQKLVRQQFDLLKAEVHDDLRKSRKAAEFGAVAAILLTVGFLALVWALAWFLNDFFHFSTWVSFLIVGGFFSIVGVALAAVSYGLLEKINANHSIHALEETLQWKTK